MIYTFTAENISELKTLLSDFHTMTGIRIAICSEDKKINIRYPENAPEICTLIQSTPNGKKICSECDERAMEFAAKRGSFYLYRCHAKLAECVMPITDGKNNIGYIMLGHMFTQNEFPDESEKILRSCISYGIPEEKASAALSKLSVISAEQISSAARLLRCLSAYILTNHLFTYSPDDVASLAEEYIRNHCGEDLSPEMLARKFGVGKTNLYSSFGKKYGVGIAAYIKNVRLAKAKELLCSEKHMSVAQVALECGFGDYNYFITVFKKRFGESPKKYASEAVH